MLLLILGSVCRLFPKMYDALAIVRPETVVRWHRAGFRSYWRWKSRRRCGRPTVPLEIRRQIREISARGVPFVYTTGNTGQSLRDGYCDRPVLKKPFKYEELAAILARLKLAPIER